MEKDAADFGIQFSADFVPVRERLPYFRIWPLDRAA
jgi:hypothetical protein